MKNIYKVSLLAVLVFLGYACDGDFEEINTNPNDPAAVSSGLLLADAQRLATNQLYSTFVGGDMGSCWSQQWSKVQYNDEERYQPRGSVIQSVWDVFYEDVAADSRKMYELAQTEGNTNMMAVARVMEAYGFSVLTDVFGDVPYSEALAAEAGIIKPVYDEQAAVYTGIIALLTEAETLFASGTGEIGSTGGTSDLIYGGDASKWRKLGNSLHFRVLMRQSGVVDVSSQLQALVSAGNMFTSNADDAGVQYLEADPNANPIYETIVFGTRGEFKVCDVLVNMLTTNGDPRLPVYVGENDNGELRGKPAGIADVPSDDYGYGNVSPVGDAYLEATAPGFIMTYSQLAFLHAEAAVRNLISGDAQTWFQAGIDASLTNVVNNLPAGSYSETLTGTQAQQLEQIANQEWLALYCQGVEAWTEWRRTGYPTLSPAADAVISTIPTRYTYPAGEQTLNATNYAAAVASQGEDRLSTSVWWDN